MSFIGKDTNDIHIYGTGKIGLLCFEYIKVIRRSKGVRGFIVSDDYKDCDRCCERQVLRLSDAIINSISGTIIKVNPFVKTKILNF